MRKVRSAGQAPAIVVLLALMVSAFLLPPSTDARAATSTASDSAARWIADHMSPTGAYGDVGRTVEAILALAAADAEGAAAARAIGFVEANFENWVKDTGGVDRGGGLGYIALAAVAMGKDPRAFGGSDIVSRIEATRMPAGADTGMYGPTVNAITAVFLHSFAMLGLHAAGASVHQDAVNWLLDQQCPNGGWMGYRSATARTQGTCGTTYTDQTALAVQALRALGVTPRHDAATYLQSVQSPDGGFAAATGTANSNSTALAVQAIVALGEDPTSGRWVQADGDNPYRALLAFQESDCADPDHGGFRFMATSSAPDSYATSQGTWGITLRPFPMTGPPSAAEPAPCGWTSPPPASPEPDAPESPGPSPSPTPTESPSSPSPAPESDRSVERVAGGDRFASAVQVSRDAFATGVPVVYLATGHGFADALAAGPAAASQSGPVLLTLPDRLPAVVADELDRLDPRRIVALGGTAVISDAVLAEAGRYGTVERVRGADRYGTAAALSQRVFAPGVSRVLVATGADFPDALAGIGAGPDGPMLLVGRDGVPEATAQELRRLAPAEVLVLGGPGAVSDDTVEALRAMVDGTVRRIAGDTRYDTAALAVREGVEAARVVYVATGLNYPDAVAAAAAAGLRGTGILLVPGDSVPDVVIEEIRRIDADRILILGGTGTVSPEAEEQLRGA